MPSRALDTETGLLLACAFAPRGRNLSASFARLAGASFVDARLTGRAARHQIRPQLAAQCAGLDRAGAGLPLIELDEFSRANRGHALLMAGEVLHLLDKLRADGVRAVPFKGPAFAAFIGQGLDTREMNDLDVIVAPDDLPTAVRALVQLGYRPTLPRHAVDSRWLVAATPELGLVAHDGTTLVELHWRLSPTWYPAPCSVDDVMASLSPRPFLHGQVLWPASEELLLVHVSDGLKSCGNGLRWVADIAHILRGAPDLDWQRVRTLASRRHGLRSVCVALAVVEKLAGEAALLLNAPELALTLPADARTLVDETRKVARLRQAVDSIRTRLASDAPIVGVVPQFRWALAMGDRPARAGAAIVRHIATPTVADLAGSRPDRASSPALPLRALRRRMFSRTRRAA